MLMEKGIIIGVTGSFGSGCSTLTEAFKTKGFEGYSLSDIIWDKWREDNSDKEDEEAEREELQDIGNKLRKDEVNEILALKTWEKVVADKNTEKNLVFDSIRNTAEINFFRNNFPLRFYLIAVECPREIRYSRVRGKQYDPQKKTQTDFNNDDDRDRNEEGFEHGQQVQRCVDDADITIQNENNISDETVQIQKLSEKIVPHIELLSGKLRPPTPEEYFMSLAYTASLKSKCFKRQVGAVIVDEFGRVLGVGCNENLEPLLKQCIDKDGPGDCQRDIDKREFFNKLKNDKQHCPNSDCQELLDFDNEFKCVACGFEMDKYLLPDKLLSRCRALHAEERALMDAKYNVSGCTLYTTASPCQTCGVKIGNAGITSIVYGEAYTDTTSLEHLRSGDIEREIKMFEGVKARAYFRIFSKWREYKEQEMRNRL
jgi:deoxycytidylate deaminase